MRLPLNRIDGKWVASSKPQALGMVVNAALLAMKKGHIRRTENV